MLAMSLLHGLLVWSWCLRGVTSDQDALTVDRLLCGARGSHGCMVAPSGCLSGGGCLASVSWTVRISGFVDFELNYARSGWVALGFSPKGLMSDSAVIECVWNTDRVIVRNSYNEGHNNMVLQGTNTNRGIYNASSYLQDSGTIYCEFIRQMNIPMTNASNGFFPDLTQSWFLILAYGNVGPSGAKHPHAFSGQEFPVSSPTKVSLYSTVFVNPVGTRTHYLKAHACLMLVAWLFFFATGILFPRHYRKTWHKVAVAGHSLWLLSHQFHVIMGCVLTVLGIFFVFISNNGNYVPLSDARPNILRAHAPLGLVIGSVVIVNIIIGFSRPKPDDSWRTAFARWHRLIGSTLFIAGVFNVMLGLSLPNGYSISATWTRFVLCGYIAFYVIIFATLEVIACTCEQKGRDSWSELQPLSADAKCDKLQSDLSDDAVGIAFPKKIIGAIYLIGVTATVCAVVIGVAVK